LKSPANDAADANDAALHRSSGPMSDVEAVLEELAARGGNLPEDFTP
jgi:hypothetical protein